MTSQLPRLNSVQGQAVIEYVLVLVVTVSLVLALSMQIFKPFGDFISNYMGKYFGCLLEYGELPTLGSSTPSEVDGDSECDKQFGAASVAGGRPPNSSSGSSESDQGTSKSKSGGKTGDESSGGGSGSSGTYAGSASRGGGGSIFSGRRPSRGVEGGSAAASGKVIEIALDGNGSSNSFFKGNSERAIRKPMSKVQTVAITGAIEEQLKKTKKKEDNQSRIVAFSEVLGPNSKKISVKPPEVKIPTKEDEPFTIGNFIRILFIAAIIIALVIFIGGQALQMSKSSQD